MFVPHSNTWELKKKNKNENKNENKNNDAGSSLLAGSVIGSFVAGIFGVVGLIFPPLLPVMWGIGGTIMVSSLGTATAGIVRQTQDHHLARFNPPSINEINLQWFAQDDNFVIEITYNQTKKYVKLVDNYLTASDNINSATIFNIYKFDTNCNFFLMEERDTNWSVGSSRNRSCGVYWGRGMSDWFELRDNILICREGETSGNSLSLRESDNSLWCYNGNGFTDVTVKFIRR